jgi:4-methylaminobutanoate oxidase (formaldehyde-forming)
MTLPTHAGIVVIGGGIIGCSSAYHLARDHKADVVLLEQGKLTSGLTGMPRAGRAVALVGAMRAQSSVVSTGAGGRNRTGDRLEDAECPGSADRWTEYKRLATTAKSFGMDMQLLSSAEVKKI